ncbi:shikimate dehydrogenase [Demequina sp. NBRC 110056]|uniref:shikimate dehydrogenase n=1 Tax=Demequina sp. NBRC 110056 TaxID=1570345 RepID=UPI000A003242|nr:shikimate dehydrogenase [Demequina sp. NBRC 110056]
MSSRRAGVLGSPIAHSLSPSLHRAAYAHLGLDWEYESYEVDAEALPGFVEALDGSWAGLSLTMPLKVTALPLVDFVEPMAKLVGAINTIVVQPVTDHLQLVGANTDVHGVVAALAEGGVTRATRGVVVGGGATATSALAALGRIGVTRPVVVVRSRGRAGGLLRAATKMGIEPRFVSFDEAPGLMADAQAVVSTVPVVVGETLAGGLGGSVPAGSVLLDAVYDPLVTPLGAAWRDAGGTFVPGTRMLLHQAAEQVRLMTGRTVPVAVLEDALPPQ